MADEEAPVIVRVLMLEGRSIGGTFYGAGEEHDLREVEAQVLLNLGLAILPPEPTPAPVPEAVEAVPQVADEAPQEPAAKSRRKPALDDIP